METDRSRYFFWGVDSASRLYVRSCGIFSLVASDHEMRREVDFAELFWPVTGHGRFVYKQKSFILRQGYVWYYPPGSFHEYYPADVFHYCWLTVAGENAGKLFELLDIKPGLNKTGPCPQQWFTALGNELSVHTAKHRVNALSTAFKILAEIGIKPRESRESQNSMLEAKKKIDTDYGDPDLNVNTLAEIYEMHRGSFSRSFHKSFDMTVSDYIVMVRLKNAIDMLSSTDCPIRRIAEECGFRSANYFSKVFLAKVGITPNEYRLKKYSRSSILKTHQEHTSNDRYAVILLEQECRTS